MRRHTLCWAMFWAMVLTSTVWAGVPQTVNFSGKLDTSGGSFSGTANVKLRMYDVSTDGTQLWTEDHTVSVTNGRFNVLMGTTSPITDSLLVGTRYLGITVAGDSEMTPRVLLQSVPYARRAGLADNATALGGNAANQYATLSALGTVATTGSYTDLTNEPWAANSTTITLEGGSTFTYGLEHSGPMRITGDNGLTNVWMGGLNNTPNLGQVTVNNEAGEARAGVFAYSSGGGVVVARGLNGKMNSALWYYGPSPDHGLLELYDNTETARVALSVHSSNAGQLRIYGPSGEMNVGLWNQTGNENNGALHLYDDSATARVSLTTGSSDQNAGRLSLTGKNGNQNTYLGYYDDNPNHGMLTLNDDAGTAAVRLTADSSTNSGKLQLYGRNGKMNSALWYYDASPDHGLLKLYDDTETARATLSAHSNTGQLVLYGPSGQKNAGLWNLSGNENNGALHLYDDSATERVSLTTGTSDQNAGKLILTGKNGNQNAYLGFYSDTPDLGLLTLNDQWGTARVRLSVDISDNYGKLQLYGPNEKINVWGGAYASKPDHGVLVLYDDEQDVSVRLDAKDTDEGSLTLYGATANKTNIWMGAYSEKDTGNMMMYGDNGEDNIWLGAYNASPNDGALQIYNSSGSSRIRMDISGDKGLMRLYGPSGNMNVYATGTSWNSNYGYIGVLDDSNGYKAGLYVNSSGQGYVFGDVKSFRMTHPEDSEKEIWYACVEGPEAAAFVRGTATLVNGQARVVLPEHFRVVAAQEGITVTLTPLSATSKGLAVVTKSPGTFTVSELHGGRGAYDFDWEVKAVRIGYEDYQPVRPKQVIAAPPPNHADESISH
jgi:hypothetical protein